MSTDIYIIGSNAPLTQALGYNVNARLKVGCRHALKGNPAVMTKVARAHMIIATSTPPFRCISIHQLLMR